ncbi:hypothetical protein [Ancylobacter sp. SL191]|uniref:hypothetical protein n=1 Tax=Ancylobacter sp. SL191 TaxID=2995166 RepID=UPI00226D6A49|nr:hypothetical protein [Ancylobacter sp. SL191]WAC26336.1 hypothetical protein OU996_15120 [Ancylobacter sp. SL191]
MSDFLHPEREPGGMLDIARLVATADSMGWEWFEQLAPGTAKGDPKAIALAITRGNRLAEAMARLAGNGDFQLLLNHLVDTTILQPVQYVALGLPIDQTALNAARREGENALVWKLLKLIAEGRKTPIGPTPTENNDEVSGSLGDGPAQRGRGQRRRKRAGG